MSMIPRPVSGALQVYLAQDGNLYAVNGADGRAYKVTGGGAPPTATGDMLKSDFATGNGQANPSKVDKAMFSEQTDPNGAAFTRSLMGATLVSSATPIPPIPSPGFSGNDFVVPVFNAAGLMNGPWGEFCTVSVQYQVDGDPLIYTSESLLFDRADGPPTNTVSLTIDETHPPFPGPNPTIVPFTMIYACNPPPASSGVKKTGDTMTGTLQIADPGGPGNAILNVNDATNSRNVRIFAQGIIYINAGGSQTILTGDGSANLVIGAGGGVQLGQAVQTKFTSDSTTGDIIATAILGPNAGKKVNLTSGKWI